MNRALAACALAVAPCLASAQKDSTAKKSPADTTGRWSDFLPLMADEAKKRGIELPRPFGVGFVFYYLTRDIQVSDVAVGKNGAPPQSVSRFAQLRSRANVDNVNVKVDAWLLPFLNVYAIGGKIWNSSSTTIDVTLPPLLPGGMPRERIVTVPTSMQGTVLGLGLAAAGGYGPFFMTVDANWISADLGFDQALQGTIVSVRGGWNGKLESHAIRTWLVFTDWNTYAQVTGTAMDPDDGGTLQFIVDQGPAYRYTYGVGAQYSVTKWFDVATDIGVDFHGGWYVGLIPVVRF